MTETASVEVRTPNSESLGFRIVSAIIITILVGYILAVIIYFNQIKQGNVPSQSEITSMLVISGILFAITVILWIWIIIRLFFSHKDRITYVNKAIQTSQKKLSSTNSGLVSSFYTPAPQILIISPPPPAGISAPVPGPAPVSNVGPFVSNEPVSKIPLQGPAPISTSGIYPRPPTVQPPPPPPPPVPVARNDVGITKDAGDIPNLPPASGVLDL